MPLPTRPPQDPHYALLGNALTPPVGSVNSLGDTLTAGPVATTTNVFGYAEGQVECFVNGAPAAKRTFCVGHNSVVNAGPSFLEGVAVAFDVVPAFRGQGIARTLHKHLTGTLRAGGVDRILVKADRDGRAAWQRYYDWDYEQSRENGTFLTTVLFATHPRRPMTAQHQAIWRARAIRLARGRVHKLPLRMSVLPKRHWADVYDAQERVARHLMASLTIAQVAELEGSVVSRLLSSTNWHGVACLSADAIAHNDALRQSVLVDVLKPPSQ